MLSRHKKWVADFKRDRESVGDDPWSGSLKFPTADDQVEIIYSVKLNDGRVTVKHIADTFGISFGSVYVVLADILGMSKSGARWVPRMLTQNQMPHSTRLKWSWPQLPSTDLNCYLSVITISG